VILPRFSKPRARARVWQSEPARPRVLYVLAEDAWFWSHRLPLARAARDAGFSVGVVTNSRSSASAVRSEGFEFFHHDFRRAGINPLYDVRTVRRLVSLYSQFRPDVVHHVAMKPVLYGSLAARIAGVPNTVNAISGLGFVLSSDSAVAKAVRPSVKSGLRFVLRTPSTRLIVQNPDDANYFVDERLITRDRVRIVRGVGVCTNTFTVSPQPEGVPLVVLPSRLLNEKGIREFVAAAGRVKEAGVQARFALVGATDANPTSLSQAEVEAIAHEGLVEVWGHRLDMHAVYESASIVCLPSYREGLPKALLEAAASGRPIVTTDVPGCRDVVRHGESGLLVPAREVEPLVGALLRLIRDRDLRERFGASGRQLVMQQFTEAQAIDDTFAVYSELVGTSFRQNPPRAEPMSPVRPSFTRAREAVVASLGEPSDHPAE
jgi:glycosyltransferase involved in cell wall biosynthesis